MSTTAIRLWIGWSVSFTSWSIFREVKESWKSRDLHKRQIAPIDGLYEGLIGSFIPPIGIYWLVCDVYT